MVRAYHVIFGVYGFWLPNDPRGSWSDWIGSWELYRHGPATKTESRRSLASVSHSHQRRQEAKTALKYPAVELDGRQALAVAQGIKQAVVESAYVVWACSILPDHAHLVIRRGERRIEQVVRHLKGRASHHLHAAGRHPLAGFANDDGSLPTPWARDLWKVYLDSASDIRRAIAYVEQNPLKEGKRAQRWSFVQTFDTSGKPDG